MTYYLLHTTDPFLILQQCEAQDYTSASSILLREVPEGAPVEVLDFNQMIQKRGKGSLSWIDETKGA